MEGMIMKDYSTVKTKSDSRRIEWNEFLKTKGNFIKYTSFLPRMEIKVILEEKEEGGS